MEQSPSEVNSRSAIPEMSRFLRNLKFHHRHKSLSWARWILSILFS